MLKTFSFGATTRESSH